MRNHRILALLLLPLVLQAETRFWNSSAPTNWVKWSQARWFLDAKRTQPLDRAIAQTDTLAGGAWFDLEGQTRTVASWSDCAVSVSNGTLRLNPRQHSRLTACDGGTIEATLTGILGHACPRGGGNVWTVKRGGCLIASGKGVKTENIQVKVEPGGRYEDRFGASVGMYCNRGGYTYSVDVAGVATFAQGLNYVSHQWGAGSPRVRLRPGGLVQVGGDIRQNKEHAQIRWRLEGGRVQITARALFEVSALTVASNATVEVVVDEGVLADLSGLTAESGARVVKMGKGTLILGERPEGLDIREGKVEFKTPEQRAELDWRFVDLKWHGDTVNRCFYLNLSRYAKEIESIAYTYPNKDRAGGLETVVTKSCFFRRRFPEGQTEPFEVRAVVTDRKGRQHTLKAMVAPRTGDRLVREPWNPDEVLVGFCTDGLFTPFLEEMITNNLCNLVCIWGNAGVMVKGPGKVAKVPAELLDRFHEKGMHLMTIYPSTTGAAGASALKEWGKRYHYCNIGEYCSYLYQGAQNCGHIPGDKDMLWQRERLVNGAIFQHLRQHAGVDYIFSTSGSPLAHYELQGGIEFICSELYAMGAANLAYATAEARGAARRWKPEYWCGWHANDWQTTGIPFLAKEKYDLLLAGYYQQWLMGTSLMVLECGAEQGQAWKYTALLPGDTNRIYYSYYTWPPTMYRATTKKFYDFTRANPRDHGSPDTNIALVLGHLGAYVGMVHGAFAMWGNHKAAATNAAWKCGRPERTWALLQDRFFPRGPAALKPYQNHNLSGSPYGQVDIVAIDDEPRDSDIARYKLLCYAGWNTMTPQAMETLERYVRKGGRLVICTPHFNTRTDREHTNYTLSDLLQPTFAGIRITGKVKSGRWHLAEVELGPNCEVVEKRGELPLIVKAKVGKGEVWLYTPWEFPGFREEEIGTPFYNLMDRLADEVQQRVVIRDLDGKPNDRIYVCYAAYGRKAYFLNVDCKNPRAVLVRFADGSTRELHLEPCTLVTLDLPETLRRTGKTQPNR